MWFAKCRQPMPFLAADADIFTDKCFKITLFPCQSSLTDSTGGRIVRWQASQTRHPPKIPHWTRLCLIASTLPIKHLILTSQAKTLSLKYPCSCVLFPFKQSNFRAELLLHSPQNTKQSPKNRLCLAVKRKHGPAFRAFFKKQCRFF